MSSRSIKLNQSPRCNAGEMRESASSTCIFSSTLDPQDLRLRACLGPLLLSRQCGEIQPVGSLLQNHQSNGSTLQLSFCRWRQWSVIKHTSSHSPGLEEADISSCSSARYAIKREVALRALNASTVALYILSIRLDWNQYALLRRMAPSVDREIFERR